MIQRIQQRREEEGFTLIELLIVIIVLAILAAIVVFALGNTRKDSVASACRTDFKSVELSAESVGTKTGKFPLTDTVWRLGRPVDDGVNALVVPSNGALLKTYPARSNSEYGIAYSSSDGRSFELTVLKQDGSSVSTLAKAHTVEGCDLPLQ